MAEDYMSNKNDWNEGKPYQTKLSKKVKILSWKMLLAVGFASKVNE